MTTRLKSKNKFIPVNRPKLFKNEKTNLNICLRDNWISSDGPFIKTFEKNFSHFNKRKYGIAVSSGTAALEVAVKSLNLKPNDEVIIPTFSIISTALAVVKFGLKPILVDSDLQNWNMLVDQVLKKITKRTKAIIVTHIYGFPVEMKKILSVAKKRRIAVIEDAAEAIGQTYKKNPCGSFGDISTFSFYANKNITTGEGGMILTNNKKLYRKCLSLRNLCFGKGNNRFNHDDIGWVYRMTNLQAAIGCGQLNNITKILKRKRDIGRRYINILSKSDKIFIQPYRLNYATNIFWVFGVLLKRKLKISRDKIVKLLLAKNIQTRNFFYPMHRQKIFLEKKIFPKKQKFKNADYLSRNGFYLPSGVGTTNKEIDFVANTLLKILKDKG